MATYTDITYHIVFATKGRTRVLDKARRDDLYRFIWGVLRHRDCHLYRIGGVEDHVHILTSLHPAVALASLVKEIKTAASAWIKGQHVFPMFDHWQEGYGAFTTDAAGRPGLIEYINGAGGTPSEKDVRGRIGGNGEGAGTGVEAGFPAVRRGMGQLLRSWDAFCGFTGGLRPPAIRG